MSGWNSREIHQPPYVTVRQEGIKLGKLEKVRSAVNQAVDILNNQTQLNSEHYVLKRILYRNGNGMRHDKLLQKLRQVEKCLKRYHEEDLGKAVSDLQKLLPLKSDVIRSGVVYVPSRAVSEYVLVKCQRTAALLGQLNAYAIQAFICAQDQLRLGHFIPNQIIFTSLISRVWFLCGSLQTQICEWYEVIQGYLKLLSQTSVSWLQDGESVPTKLDKWLGEEGLMALKPSQQKKSGRIKRLDKVLNKIAKTPDDVEKDAPTASVEEQASAIGSDDLLMTAVNSDLCDLGAPVRRRACLNTASQQLKRTPNRGSKRKRSKTTGGLHLNQEAGSLTVLRTPEVMNKGCKAQSHRKGDVEMKTQKADVSSFKRKKDKNWNERLAGDRNPSFSEDRRKKTRDENKNDIKKRTLTGKMSVKSAVDQDHCDENDKEVEVTRDQIQRSQPKKTRKKLKKDVKRLQNSNKKVKGQGKAISETLTQRPELLKSIHITVSDEKIIKAPVASKQNLGKPKDNPSLPSSGVKHKKTKYKQTESSARDAAPVVDFQLLRQNVKKTRDDPRDLYQTLRLVKSELKSRRVKGFTHFKPFSEKLKHLKSSRDSEGRKISSHGIADKVLKKLKKVERCYNQH